MALTFASYAAPDDPWARRGLGLAAVVTLTAVNYRGITRTAALARVLLGVTLLSLLVVVVAIWAGGTGHVGLEDELGSPYGVLQAAGLLFFAFAGYARVATLGEEVREPARTIPRAIVLALAIVVAIYFVVGVSALAAAGPAALAATTTPLATAVDAVGAAWAIPVVRVGAAVASLGALLALIAGVGRTAFAMARNGELPRWLAAIHPRYDVPAHAELAVGVAVCALVLTLDLRGAIGFSSFAVLAYYAIANASAWTQEPEWRRFPRLLNVLGLIGCVTLAVTLPPAAVGAGSVVLASGLVWHLVARRTASSRRAP